MVKQPESNVPAPGGQKGGQENGDPEFYAKVDTGYARTESLPAAPTAAPPRQPEAIEGQAAEPAAPAPAPAAPVQPPPVQPPPVQPAPAAPAPAPAAPAIDMSSPESTSKVLADTMVQAFVDRMKAEANAKGGHLSVQDLENMQDDFDRLAAGLSGALAQSFEVYVKARERSVWDQQRDYPFDRLMVQRFSQLFKEGDTLGPEDLSRRMLPGFFVALGMMLGPDVVEENQQKLRVVVERVHSQGKSVFNWEDVYQDQTSKGVALSTEVAIAIHFDEFEKRSEWFINMVNGHLAPVDAETHPNVANWEMTPVRFNNFLHGLLKDLRAQLDTDSGKMAITKRYGAEACAGLFDILTLVGD